MSTIFNPVTVVISFQIREDKIILAKQALSTFAKAVLDTEEGCREIRMHEDPADPKKFLLIEYWSDRDLLSGSHMDTAHSKAFRKEVEAYVEIEPKVTFWEEVLFRNAF